jgi:hypothetical protein
MCNGWAERRSSGLLMTRWGFPGKFTDTMLASEENFALAIDGSGVEMSIPKREYSIPPEMLTELDALYEEWSPPGYHSGWGVLVETLPDG